MPKGGGQGQQPRRRNWRWLAWLLGGYLLVFGLLTTQDQMAGVETVSYTEFTAQVEDGNVAEVFSRGDSIQGVLRRARPVPGVPDRTYREFETARPAFAQDDLLDALEDSGATVRATPVVEERGTLFNLLFSFAPILLLVAFYYWVFKRQQQAMGGGLFGTGRQQKPVDPETVRVTFDDVAGIDEVEAEIFEIVDYLKDPDKYRRVGARAPKGVLLAGPPGTGKTLLARATAGEADVPFFSASASEFIEMVVGVGASRVRDLFDQARKVAPAIVFIDEIDAVGRARGRGGSVGGVDEREQTLNQILTEMDGFSGFEGIVVLAATNRIDVLDPALLRPGRFDRRVTVGAPDLRGREQILRVHTRDVPLADEVDLGALAASTPGMVGADLANLVNEAALLAARRRHETVTMRDLREALDKVVLGTARHLVMPAVERKRTAYHEAGHAVLGIVVPGADPVRKVSIVPRGMALGVTFQTPDEDRYGYTRGQLRARIVGLLGGRAAEELVLDDVSTGAESDLDRVASLARMMVGRWGMSPEIGPLAVLPRDEGAFPGADGRLPSDELRRRVDTEIRRIVDECYRQALDLLREHRAQLDALATALLEQETIDEEEIYRVVGVERPAREAGPAPVT